MAFFLSYYFVSGPYVVDKNNVYDIDLHLLVLDY